VRMPVIVVDLVSRGYTKSSQGNPDESRAARYILKDYVNGKLLHVTAPPEVDEKKFNKEVYEDRDWLSKHIKKMEEIVIQKQEEIDATVVFLFYSEPCNQCKES
jgi:predicted metal-dependent hydrolase